MPKRKNTKNKKAYKSSESKKNIEEPIDLDEEIIIGMKNNVKEQKSKNNKNNRQKERIKSKSKSKNRKMTQKEINKRTSPKTKTQKIYTEEEIEKIAKKRKFASKVIKRIFVFLVLLTAIVLFMLSPLFGITEIEVQGVNKITEQTVINLSEIQVGQNIFSINKNRIKKAVCENPYVEDVTITRNLPSAVIIKIKERKASFMLEIGGAYAYINNQGYILEIATENINVPIIQGYTTDVDKIAAGNRLETEDLKRLDTVLKIMESARSNEIDNMITKINVENQNNYVLVLEGEGKTAYIGDASNINTRMLYLREILDRQQGVRGEIFVDKDVNTKKAVFREEI